MSFQLTSYQENAVNELLKSTRKLLRQSDGKKLVFKAPTGSGKTIMMAEFLSQFADDGAHPPCAFIWTAPRQLHEQSKEKLEAYFENSRAMECRYFDDLNDKQIGENEILFFNWESIRQNSNIYIRENEQDSNLSSIIKNTREAGREIVLIIDESHFHAQAETSQNLIVAIAPKLTIEVSATPVINSPDSIVNVDIDEIKEEGITNKAMIKKGVILNEDFKNVVSRSKTKVIKSELASSTDDIVLREALKKREQLVKLYKTINLKINPLLLIQLPDRRGQSDDDRQTAIVRTLNDKHAINIDNGKLAIYLSEDKKNLENITRNESEVEVLIFKQAIALGWDCPRAQVLVLFREWSSPIFSIQTIGRIMRMPEPEDGYYDEDTLNYAYVYTNLDDIEITEDVGRNYVVIHTSKRIQKYQSIKLQSAHSKRHREQTRLSPLFTRLFLEATATYGLEKKIKIKSQHVHPAFISDWKTGNIDTVAGIHLEANVELDTASDMDLQRLFDYFVKKNLSPFYPEDRSVGRVKEGIYQFFNKYLKMDRVQDFQNIINIVLSEDNRQHFIDAIDVAKRAYIADTEKKDRELIEEMWDVPEKVVYGDGYVETGAKKSVMQPFYSDENWKSETKFIDFLETPRNNISWWFKNGSRDATFFAIPYSNGKSRALFYVDFVVLMKNGTVGLFDPHGIHLADFGEKSDGLQSYVSALKKKGHKVIGGIVANTDQRNFTGRWMLYTGKGKDARENDWDGWIQLEI